MTQRSAHVCGFRRQIRVEPRRELHAPEDSQRVLDKMVAGGSKYPVLQIRYSAVRIEQRLVMGVAINGVDGEVASRGSLGDRHRVVHLDLESSMATTGLAFSARQREVDIFRSRSVQFDHSKRNPNFVDPSKPR